MRINLTDDKEFAKQIEVIEARIKEITEQDEAGLIVAGFMSASVVPFMYQLRKAVQEGNRPDLLQSALSDVFATMALTLVETTVSSDPAVIVANVQGIMQGGLRGAERSLQALVQAQREGVLKQPPAPAKTTTRQRRAEKKRSRR